MVTRLSTIQTCLQLKFDALAAKMDKRMENDSDAARASGILVNTNGWIQNVRALMHDVCGKEVTWPHVVHSLILIHYCIIGRI